MKSNIKVNYHPVFKDKIESYFHNEYWFFKIYDKHTGEEVYCETSDGFTLFYHTDKDGKIFTELIPLPSYHNPNYILENRAYWEFSWRFNMAKSKSDPFLVIL